MSIPSDLTKINKDAISIKLGDDQKQTDSKYGFDWNVISY
jgi:hypothetical protein